MGFLDVSTFESYEKSERVGGFLGLKSHKIASSLQGDSHRSPMHMGVSIKYGEETKWMVKIMENPTNMDDLEVPLFLETSIST